MPTKADLLAKLDEDSLKKIAKSEGYPIPKTFGKKDLVKYLNGMLTLEKIKEYTAEVYEKETKREIIRETIKEKGIRVKAKETEKIELNKPQLLHEIITSKVKIDKSVIEEIATYLHEPMPNGTGYNLYNNMNERMLETVHRIFIKNENDGKGRNLEYQFANFLMKHTNADIARIKIRAELPKVGEIDVLAFDSNDQPILMAECKDRPVKYEDVDKWIMNIKRIHSEYDASLLEAYFVGSNGYTQGTVKHVEDLKDIDPLKGTLKMGTGAAVKDFFKKGLKIRVDSEALYVGSDAGKIFVSMFDVRENQFVKILPHP